MELPDRETVQKAVLVFVNARTWNESKRLLEEQQKVLLTDVADQVLADLLEHYQGDENAVRTLNDHRTLLRRARAEGIDAAFAERMQPRPTPDISPELLARLQAVQSEEELHQLLAEHPELMPVLEQMAQQAAQRSSVGPIPSEIQPLLAELQRLTQRSDMPRRVAVCQEAVRLVDRTQQPALWAALQVDLGNSMQQTPFGERAENREQAIAHYQQALEVRTRAALPVEWATTMMNLGNAYRNRIRGERAENREQAIAHLQQSLEVQTPEALPQECRTTATVMGRLQVEIRQFTEAMETFNTALDADAILYQTALSRAGKESTLSEARSLSPMAAYATAHHGNLNDAVVIMERGRARMLGEAMARDRANLDVLRQQVPDLAQRYQDAAAIIQGLEQRERSSLTTTQPTENADQAYLAHSAAMREAQEALQAAVEEIRQIPGYETFLALPDWDTLSAAVQPDTPLVYVATIDVGSLALIVHRPAPDTEPTVTPLWLNNFTETNLITLLTDEGDELIPDSWLGAYTRRRANPKAWFDTMERVTHALWEPMMEPLVRQLQDMHLTQAVLIPSGYLALLPLHAAWAEPQDQRHYALDSICFSYAPAARILTQAQQAATTPDDTLLVINEPQPVRADRLPGTQAEADAVTVHFEPVHTLSAEAATRQAVQERLPLARIVHFSCHGGMDWDNPLQSGLLMANDELLTVQDVFDLRLEAARLAVLSACETGMVGIDVPDEVVMLPSALMQAGFVGVVSSLWSVSDASTAILMERFYHFWRVEQHSPAEALRRAQQWLRDTTNGEKRAYYEQFIPQYGGQPGRVPEPTARFFRRAFITTPPDENRFAHPFYWAAFSYTGV